MPPRCDDPVTRYAEDAVAGRVVAGRLARLACQRHLNDLEHGHERGLRWSWPKAKRIIDFFGQLRLYDGKFRGQSFLLQPFQQFIVGCIFGWLAADGFRRFRNTFIETAKGTGKTPVTSGIGLYGLVADREPGAEIYAAATSLGQAKILFRDACAIAKASPELCDLLDIQKTSIAYPEMDAFFQPVASDHKAHSGPRPHFNLVDEVHEHPDGNLIEKMEAGIKARRQPLTFEITNAGCDKETICWQHHEYSIKILEGILENDQWFAYIATLDPCDACWQNGFRQPNDGCEECDDWRDESVWEKANPGLGKINTVEYLRGRVKLAAGMPAKEAIVKRLNFTIWTESATRAIPMDRWQACTTQVNLDDLEGTECYAGLDIGATSDFTAFILLFAHDDIEFFEVPVDPQDPDGPQREIMRRSYTLVPYFWLPSRPRKRDERMMELIDLWVREGFIKETAGDTVDYDVVFADILELSERFPFRKLAFDRGFQGVAIGTKLMNVFGPDVIQVFPQGLLSMAAPFREFLELLLNGRLKNDGNPVLKWMASNTAAETKSGLSKPSKDHSGDKIDGIVAAVMALGAAMANVDSSGEATISFI